MSSTQGQTQTLSRSQARRVALAAQGFLDKPHAGPTMRTFDRTLARTGVLQVDSVNVLQRAHYMPLYSRMGPYDADPRTGLLARAAEKRPRRVVEYWAHVQAFMPVDLWPLMQHRMDFYRAARGKWWKDVEDSMIERVRVAVAAQPGPVTARELEQVIGSGGPRSKEHWGWNWSEARKTLDFLYQIGELAIAGRTTQFEVRYDLPERVLPAQILDLPVLDPQDAVTELVRRAARSHGVATASCLADYYRLRQQHDPKRPDLPSTAVAIEQLVGTGESSTSTTASRSTRPRRSGCTATTCCRSCWGRRSWRASTSRPTGPPPTGASCGSRPPGPSPAPPLRRPSSWQPSCGAWRAGWGWSGSPSRHAGTSPPSCPRPCRQSVRDGSPRWVE